MVSTFGSLNTVVTGMQAHQLALNTTGHNISNADTPGYSRQRLNLVASSSQTIYTNGGGKQLGMGVTSQTITRIRDTFIDRQYWKENSVLGANATKKTYLTKIEDVFGEPLDTGMQSLMTTFWKSLETLSTEASNHSARAVVIQNGVSMCTTVQQETSQFMSMVADINVVIGLRVDSINQMTDELLTLNKKITTIEAGKLDNANDLRDRRDYLVDQLSYLMKIQVTEDNEGAYIISGGGINLLTATTRHELSTQSRMDPDYGYEVIDVTSAKTGQALTFTSGEMSALINTRDSEESGVKKYLNDLSNMAKFLLQEFNDVHKAGVDLNGDAGDNFFGVPGTDYNDPAVASTFRRVDWLRHFQVSTDLTDPNTGTYKVAARTLLGETIQSNPQSGHAIVGYDPAVTAQSVIDAFNNHITPTSDLPPLPAEAPICATVSWKLQDVAISAEIASVDKDGNVTGMTYSYTYSFIAMGGNGEPILDADGNPYIDTTITGKGTCDQLTDPDTGSITFILSDSNNSENDPAVANLTIQVARSNNNTPGSAYSFSISAKTNEAKMQGIGSGDNAINLSNRLQKDISKTLSNTSLNTYYATQMGVLGAQASNAERTADNQQAVIDQLLEMRESVRGVNQEEELVDMVRFQKGFNSASRMITAMDEMLDKLINGTGRVGA